MGSPFRFFLSAVAEEILDRNLPKLRTTREG
jgi:hypothetical protein